MVILNPLEPWPGELVLPRRRAPRREADHPRRRLRRAVPRRRAARATSSRATTTAASGPAGWVEAGRAKLEAMRADRRAPRADDAAARLPLEPRARAGRRCVAPTLIAGARQREVDRGQARRAGRGARPERAQRRGGRGDPRDRRQHAARWLLKGAAPDFEGEPLPDRWPITPELTALAGPLGHRARPRPDQSGLRHGAPRVDHPGQDDPPARHRCRRLRARHARAADLRAARTRTANKLTHLDTRSQLQDVNLAEVVTTAQAQGDGTDGLPTTWCGDETDRRQHGQRRDAGRQAAVQGRLRLRRRPPEPLRRLAATRCRPTSRSSSASCPPRTAAPRACASTWARAAARSTSTSRSSSCPAPAPPTPTTSARSPPPSSAPSAPPAARATRSCSPTASPAPRRSTASARPSWARPASARAPTNVHNRGGLTSILFSRDGAAAPGAPAGAGGRRASCTR